MRFQSQRQAQLGECVFPVGHQGSSACFAVYDTAVPRWIGWHRWLDRWVPGRGANVADLAFPLEDNPWRVPIDSLDTSERQPYNCFSSTASAIPERKASAHVLARSKILW
jgi:hypothetical protein